MKALVVGADGGAHAVAWKLAQSPAVRTLATAPGNYGTNLVGANVNLPETDPEGLAAWAAEEKIDLTVVTSPLALAYGVVDAFKERGLRVVGPTQQATRLATSRAWAKEFMARHDIPTVPARRFEDVGSATAHVQTAPADDFPLLLTAERGVEERRALVEDRETALGALSRLFAPERYAPPAQRMVIEPYLHERTVSVLAIWDGATLLPIGAVHCDRRAFDGGRGPLVPGMGAYCPVPGLDDEQFQRVMDRAVRPIVEGLVAEGLGYNGVLCVEVALGSSALRVQDVYPLLGGPEAQVLLPRWEDDLYVVLDAACDAALAELRPFRWRPDSACGVVIASEGYPGEYETGYGIIGTGDVPSGTLLFHINTRNPFRKSGGPVTPKVERATRSNMGRGFSSWFIPARGRARKVDAQASQASGDPYSQIITTGGPVVTVVGSGHTLIEARAAAYRGVEVVTFTGCWSRGDIGSVAGRLGG